MEQKNFEEALIDAKNHIKTDPEDKESILALARCYFGLQEYEKALKFAQKGLNPRVYDLELNKICFTSYIKCQDSPSIEDFESANKKYPIGSGLLEEYKKSFLDG